MTPNEYEKRQKEISLEYDKKLSALAREYAFANSPFKIGDIIADSTTILKIERMEVWPFIRTYPTCAYFGIELKKDGTPKKIQTHVAVFQGNARAVSA